MPDQEELEGLLEEFTDKLILFTACIKKRDFRPTIELSREMGYLGEEIELLFEKMMNETGLLECNKELEECSGLREEMAAWDNEFEQEG